VKPDTNKKLMGYWAMSDYLLIKNDLKGVEFKEHIESP
jgi:hypothetical protein